MNPIEAAKKIESRLKNYIRYSLPVERSMPAFTPKLEELFSGHRMTQDPYMELIPPYTIGSSLQELADEGVIHRETAKILAKAFGARDCDPANFSLYQHQTEAVRNVCRDGSNLVVCSGTGSGKTECFLIPLLDYLVRQWVDAGRGENWNITGVRAMLLYPMNALVNDQIRRLRAILKHAPFITFGKYTGQLTQVSDEKSLDQGFIDNLQEHSRHMASQEGVRWSGAGFDDEAPLPNEWTRRSQWQNQPAHILVTNYSMLEHLLLKPENAAIFGETWKFIILDEAHCYTGAVGTEIAWLVRRVKRRLGNPDRLRFLATSATLIDDPGLTEAQKCEAIRTNFASKLFPAAPETFCVQFGKAAAYQAHDGATQQPRAAQPRDYQQIISSSLNDEQFGRLTQALNGFQSILPSDVTGQPTRNLFELTQVALGVERWLLAMDAARDMAAHHANGQVSAGDALFLVGTVKAAADAGMIPLAVQHRAAIDRGFLGGDSLPRLQAIVRFLQQGVGQIAERPDLNDWRERLHDDADPRPSNWPGDVYQLNGQPQQSRRGNRLLILKQWQAILRNGLSELNVEGFSRLLDNAVDLAVLVEQDWEIVINPKDLPVQFSPAAQAAFAYFVTQCEALAQAIVQARRILSGAWKQVLVQIGMVADAQPMPERIEALLANTLGGDRNLSQLVTHLLAARADWQNADSGKLSSAARALFPDVDENENRLIDLVRLATMAVPEGSRRPLLDVRYHQLLRGIGEVGIQFIQGGNGAQDNGAQDFSLTTHSGDEKDGRAIFNLGLCRNCGQPFALGYSDLSDIAGHQGDLLLKRERSDSHPCLHAFAWRRGEEFPDSEEGFPQAADGGMMFLNGRTGKVVHEQGEDCIAVEWYVTSENGNDRREFLQQCPCCGSGGAHQGTERRYGVITPFTAEGPQLRVVALEELARLTDRSNNPAARSHPGEGRKVLAFSDSRNGAAKLALNFQGFFLNATMPRFVKDETHLISAQPPDESLRSLLSAYVMAANPGFAAMPAELLRQVLDAIIIRWLQERNVTTNALALSVVMDRLNCGRLLEIANASGTEDLSDSDAAAVLLLGALRKKSRYGLLQRGTVEVASISIQQARTNNLPAWQQAMAQTGLGPDQLSALCSRIHTYLFQTAKIDMPSEWPNELVNGQYAKTVYQGEPAPGEQNALRFVTGQRRNNSRLNRFVRSSLQLLDNEVGFRQAGDCLAAIWPLFAPQGNQGAQGALINVGANGGHEVNRSDISVSIPAGQIGVEQLQPHEREEANLATREVVPVRIEEHTAQISTARGAAYQRGFAEGRINVLSCSTTFEMGVDLGDLTTAFLANLPPGTANYRQRAGRAGRRPGTAAYVLSFVGGSAHDDYFFHRAARLLFGPMETPRIYLENPIFRARHLRAEAMHCFLKWMGDNQHWPAQNTLIPMNAPFITRKWNSVGDFFIGRKAGKVQWGAQNRHRPLRAVFDPVVGKMSDWLATEEAVIGYIQEISDVPPNLGYSVAADLIWQLLKQADIAVAVAPYELPDTNNVHQYRQLGGPNVPAVAENQLQLDPNPKRQSVQSQTESRFSVQNAGAGVNRVSLAAGRLLNETTINWLSRCRVLPKYGFPVDVVELLPDQNDPHKDNANLQRDLKLGLYEYAPGQSVVADKRVYESARPIVFLPGGIQGQLDDVASQRFICTGCREVWNNMPMNNLCPVCRSNVDPVRTIEPDAFQAEMSRAATGHNYAQRGTPLHVYTGGTRAQTRRTVEDVRMETAESESGTVSYINQGPGYQGFDQGANGQSYSLYHEVHTDIAVWLPHIGLFHNNGAIGGLLGQRQPFQGQDWLRPAMQSALEALLRAASLELGINANEIAGLLYCHPDAAGRPAHGFVLFDDSSGGGGAVLPLVLSGINGIDEPRHALVRRVVRRAIELCNACTECGGDLQGLRAFQTPIARENYLGLPENQREGYRIRQSCYKCLRSYRNQRFHDYLDRFEAALILGALLGGANGGPQGTVAPPLSPQPPEPVTEIPDTDEFELGAIRGLQGPGPFRFKRAEPQQLSGVVKCLVRLSDAQYVVGWVNTNISPWSLTGAGASHNIESSNVIAVVI